MLSRTVYLRRSLNFEVTGKYADVCGEGYRRRKAAASIFNLPSSYYIPTVQSVR
jgi:hypothetical protein